MRRAADGEVLVSGAAGGVGSVAVALLAALGYRVAASTGRAEAHAYLRALGATTIVERAEFEAPQARPLASERWAGAIDSVGGTTLAERARPASHPTRAARPSGLPAGPASRLP